MTAGSTATIGDAGRPCPYCRFALKSGIGVTTCASCDAVHHAECWLDNGGCAIVACDGGPRQTGAADPALPPPAASPQAAVPRPRGRAPLLGAAALAIAGAAAAITFLIAGGADGEPGAVAPVVTAQVPASAPQDTVDEPTASVATVATPKTSSAPKVAVRGAAEERRSAIQGAVRDYFREVRTGSLDDAWELLSPTYRAWKATNAGGFARWRRQESRNRQRLRGPDPVVKVQTYDPASGVATIYVSGMRFKPERRPECPYVGVTWAREVGGRWLYDQGYSQNSTREARWQPRRAETLGSSCDTSGY